MTNSPAIVALVATLALGIAAGLLHLQRRRLRKLVIAHLVAALAAIGLVALLVLRAPAAPTSGVAGVLPLGMLAGAGIAGWSALRIARRGWPRAELVLASHVILGVAGFLVFLAWIKPS